MTSSAPKFGRINAPASVLSSGRALDAFFVRDVIANNALHCADQAPAVVLSNWVVPTSTLFATNPTLYVADSAARGVDEWTPLYVSDVVMPQRSSGAGYTARVELLGATSNAAATASFRVRFVAEGASDGVHAALTFTTSSTTAAWLSAASNTIAVGADVAEGASRARETYDDAGGTPVSVAVSIPRLVVDAKTSSSSGVARLYGLHVALYGGA